MGKNNIDSSPAPSQWPGMGERVFRVLPMIINDFFGGPYSDA